MTFVFTDSVRMMAEVYMCMRTSTFIVINAWHMHTRVSSSSQFVCVCVYQGCWFGTMAPQLVPDQLTVVSNTKFLVPELGSSCMIEGAGEPKLHPCPLYPTTWFSLNKFNEYVLNLSWLCMQCQAEFWHQKVVSTLKQLPLVHVPALLSPSSIG